MGGGELLGGCSFMDFLGVGFVGLGLLFLLGVLGLGGAGSSVPPASHK